MTIKKTRKKINATNKYKTGNEKIMQIKKDGEKERGIVINKNCLCAFNVI